MGGTKIYIAIAGLAAHLAGTIAAKTTKPVICIPAENGPLSGIDALLSTVQMPAGVPVGTLAIGKAGAINSALFAISILGIKYPKVLQKLKKYRSNFEKKIPQKPS